MGQINSRPPEDWWYWHRESELRPPERWPVPPPWTHLYSLIIMLSLSLCVVIIICFLFCRALLAKAYGKVGKYQMEQLLINEWMGFFVFEGLLSLLCYVNNSLLNCISYFHIIYTCSSQDWPNHLVLIYCFWEHDVRHVLWFFQGWKFSAKKKRKRKKEDRIGNLFIKKKLKIWYSFN